MVEAQNQRDIAEAQRDIAEAQRAEAVFQSERAERVSLAANSQVALTNNNTDLSIALALAANAGNPSLRSGETERALAEAAYSAGTISRFTGHVLQDSDLQHTLSRNGRALIESSYSWASSADKYEALYDAVIGKH